MTMTDADRRMRETVIEFASCLYGGAWKERLAEVSGMPKRAVADWFRSDKALPQALPLTMLRAMQNDAEAQIAEKQALCEQVKALRLELVARPANTATTPAPAANTPVVSTPSISTPAIYDPQAAEGDLLATARALVEKVDPGFPSEDTENADVAISESDVSDDDLQIPASPTANQPFAARRTKARRALRLVVSREA